MQKILDFLNNGYVVNIICVLLSSFCTWLITKKNFRGWFKKQRFRLLYFVRRHPVVLVWCDELQCSKNIVSGLSQIPGRYRYICLSKIMELLNYPLTPKYIHAVLLIDTDVVRFGNNEKDRERVQSVLLKYLRAGGGVIGGHDVLYKRVRNDMLIQETGCNITQFMRVAKPVEYKVMEIYQNSYFKDVPSVFTLWDGEICWGKITNDVKALAVTTLPSSRKIVPVIYLKRIERGVFLWVNSGDKDVEACRSLTEADVNLLRIFRNFFDCYRADCLPPPG